MAALDYMIRRTYPLWVGAFASGLWRVHYFSLILLVGCSGNAELSIVLCDDPHIQQLNREHRDKDAPTDVLSFPMGSDHFPVHGAAPTMLGDLIISLDTAQQQASQQEYVQVHPGAVHHNNHWCMCRLTWFK